MEKRQPFSEVEINFSVAGDLTVTVNVAAYLLMGYNTQHKNNPLRRNMILLGERGLIQFYSNPVGFMKFNYTFTSFFISRPLFPEIRIFLYSYIRCFEMRVKALLSLLRVVIQTLDRDTSQY